MSEKVKLHTITKVYKFHDPDGSIAKMLQHGAKLEDIGTTPIEVRKVEGNIFLNEGINYIWNAVIGTSGLTPFNQANSYIGVGDGTTAPSVSQTGLQGTNIYYKQVDSGYPQIVGTTLVFRATFGPDEANFSWQEWSVANGNSNAAVNLNRKVENLGTKSSGSTWGLEVQLTLT